MSRTAITDLEKRRDAALKAAAPNIVIAEGANWQQLKSAQTREALLNATIECLAEVGYSKTTTQLVTKRAKISRGSMLHHFASKQDLIKQTIEFTFYKRIYRFYDDTSSLTEQQRVQEVAAIQVVWNEMNSKEFEAYLELSMAARTDTELRKIFEPLDNKFQKTIYSQLPILFPEWKEKEEELKLARDLVMTSMYGLFLNTHIIEPKSRRAMFRKLIMSILPQIMNGNIKIPEVSKSEISTMRE